MSASNPRLWLLASSFLALSCAHPSTAEKSDEAAGFGRQVPIPWSRGAFNVRAAERALPLFWRADFNGDGALQADELALVWGLDDQPRSAWVTPEGTFTPRFYAALGRLRADAIPEETNAADKARLEKVREELAQGRPTLVHNDLRSVPAAEKAFVEAALEAGATVERIYARQSGTFGLREQIPETDGLSRALAFRNQTAACMAPKTQGDAQCTALTGASKVSGLYPAELQSQPQFCAALEKLPNASKLTGHFDVVLKAYPKGYQAAPYATAYSDDGARVAAALEKAATALEVSEGEAALRFYLQSAAKAFKTNDWERANEAWVRMNADNSSWYLRIAPDETYADPCGWKAGFGMTLGRIDPMGKEWRDALEPVKAEMETALAGLAGAPYRARTVGFSLPDFIDVVVNTGDARKPLGATVGQSLPNWGRVSEKGGRTVVMGNLYRDEDSRQALAEQARSLLCAETAAKFSTEPEHALRSVVLHEAAHNLGPSHEYKVKGKVDDAVFGGSLAQTLEELKAQTAALFFTEWLVEKGKLSADAAAKAHLRDVVWAFDQVSRGMYDGSRNPKHYGQLASMQLGMLRDDGVLVWHPDAMAANGKDRGCFDVTLAKWKPSVHAMATKVLGIKARGDKAAAEGLKARYVDAKDDWSAAREVIASRWLRSPKASFYYSVEL